MYFSRGYWNPSQAGCRFDPKRSPPRPDLLWLKPADIASLKAAHSKFLQDVKEDGLSMSYVADTTGIVMTVAGNRFPVLLTSLLMLRKTGTTLPVEVFLDSHKDYNAKLCDSILPSMNAKCIVFGDIVRASDSGVELQGYQFKMIALLFSSFESVLLLDADAFPTTDPSYVFTSEVFERHGMILYPDFWYPSESPYYFEIASIRKMPNLSARPSIESGEIFLNKRKHNFTLLLAAYYNYFGPDYYYVLHSQGAPGQGDKETFGWAAIATNNSFYLVHKGVEPMGHFDSNGDFVGSAMAQFDPVADYAYYQAPSGDSPGDSPKDTEKTDSDFPAADPRPDRNISQSPSTPNIQALFLHANFPKFDPSTFFLSTTQPPDRANPSFDSNGTALKPWGASLPVPNALVADYDIEAAFWEEIETVSCKYGREDGVFGDWSLRAIVGKGGNVVGKGGREKAEAEARMDVCDVVGAWKGKAFGGGE
ncbi:Alpha-1,2-mannosyltransferase MNN2 [Cyphellophora attinorum]|uniref:Alpha-1,2-mannosyltransferase MNN2 n=1 Tax=Cyphellophora attinorum TaxID=1664694 RepID=A0A0N1NXL1_9EURO|nr:Alpha-1,2-mannosyltransferase MNN2 [Phialophora attinorum]KPI35112.1 Alpha-1,2-mannosyltransferase MNN2 [Phialophora attinorum]